MIHIKIRNAEGGAVALDSYRVVRKDNGSDLGLEPEQTAIQNMRETGEYLLIDDSFSEQLRNSEQVVKFEGFKDGEMIVSEDYTVGADCCHVRLISGNPELVIRG
ncbi:hypothetical protein [Robertkochia aurantiaca]|uniref:hypothetical protein n=1 Tax=Robertkochia aurantiaca TaxID=2873700 RepID=UPI001CCD31C7|nr:hypothetical protein [Robertkochia sp. 3YJGBD-33]